MPYEQHKSSKRVNPSFKAMQLRIIAAPIRTICLYWKRNTPGCNQGSGNLAGMRSAGQSPSAGRVASLPQFSVSASSRKRENHGEHGRGNFAQPWAFGGAFRKSDLTAIRRRRSIATSIGKAIPTSPPRQGDEQPESSAPAMPILNFTDLTENSSFHRWAYDAWAAQGCFVRENFTASRLTSRKMLPPYGYRTYQFRSEP